MNQLLELKNITAGYEGKPILQQVNFSIHEGEFIGVIGHNGGGKNTLLKVILYGVPTPSWHNRWKNLFSVRKEKVIHWEAW